MAIGSSRSDFQVAAVRKRLFGNSHSTIECADAARGGRAALLAAGVLVVWGAESKRSDRGQSAEAAGCRLYLARRASHDGRRIAHGQLAFDCSETRLLADFPLATIAAAWLSGWKA